MNFSIAEFFLDNNDKIKNEINKKRRLCSVNSMSIISTREH